MSEQVLTVADIYCGAGGLSAGFALAAHTLPSGQNVRFEIVFGIDKDKDAMKTFRAYHFPNIQEPDLEVVAPCIDIADVTAAKVLDAARKSGHDQLDVLIGGPNCQGVSAAGLRNPGDERNKMLITFIDLVRELRPKWFVMENVPGLTHANNLRLLRAILEEFESIGGYSIGCDVLLAADYGVPQLRYRLFIVGTTTGNPIRFPMPSHYPPKAIDGVLVHGDNTYQTVGTAIMDLANIRPQSYGEDEAPGFAPIPNHYCARTKTGNVTRISTVPAGGDWRNMLIQHLPERNFATRASDQKGAYGRLMWDWPAYTITNETGNVTAGPFTHPDQDRPLSVREAARLQSFADEHIFFGEVMSQYRQVGNAVPPRLAKAVATTILLSHFTPQEASVDTREGRLDLQIVTEAVDKKRELPTLTPRRVHPLLGASVLRKPVPAARNSGHNRHRVSVWDQSLRPVETPFPSHEASLRLLAKQPNNIKAAKRAQAIVEFIDGKPKDLIVKSANVGEESLRKWVDGYFAEGLNGWRAYHTPLEQIADYDENRLQELRQRIEKVRLFDLEPHKNGSSNGQPHKRLHMNAYLVELKNRYAQFSVAQLIAKVEQALGYGIGTVYVDDLLAIADVVLGKMSPGELDNPGG